VALLKNPIPAGGLAGSFRPVSVGGLSYGFFGSSEADIPVNSGGFAAQFAAVAEHQ